MQAQLRKHQHSLVLSGGALIFFVFWAILKIVLSMVLRHSATIEVSLHADEDLLLLAEALESPNTLFLLLILAIFFLSISFVGILLQIYVGRTAIAVGSDRKPDKKGYIVLAIILFAFSLSSDVLSLMQTNYSDLGLIKIASAIVEAAALYAYFDIIYSAIKVRKLSKLIRSQEETLPDREVTAL